MHVRTVILGGALLATGIAVSGTTPAASADPTSVDFAATGSEQTWTVPAGVTSVDVTLCGAQGASNDGTRGGLGAQVDAVLAVTPGEQLVITVGGAGSGANGGFNGGGDGGPTNGVGGGGATDVRQGGTALSDRVLVAGGGGGTGPSDISPSPNGGGDGGAPGLDGNSPPNAGLGGGAGSGGAGGTGTGTGGAGSLGLGGDGDDAGSGGGGGYYGGGGGAGEVSIISTGPNPGASVSLRNGGGGGGGSSYAGTDDTITDGACQGDGTAVLSYELDTTTSSTTTTTSPNNDDPGDVGNNGAGNGYAPGARPVRGTASYTG